MVKVKCRRCGYEWDTQSQMIMINCSSCNYKQKKSKMIIDDKDRKKWEEEVEENMRRRTIKSVKKNN